jgi:hypothetical protein
MIIFFTPLNLRWFLHNNINWNRQEFKKKSARRQWLTSIILATQETEIRRIAVQSQPGEIFQETLF